MDLSVGPYKLKDSFILSHDCIDYKTSSCKGEAHKAKINLHIPEDIKSNTARLLSEKPTLEMDIHY